MNCAVQFRQIVAVLERCNYVMISFILAAECFFGSV